MYASNGRRPKGQLGTATELGGLESQSALYHTALTCPSTYLVQDVTNKAIACTVAMDSSLVGHRSSKENITDMMALSKAEGQISCECHVHSWA